MILIVFFCVIELICVSNSYIDYINFKTYSKWEYSLSSSNLQCAEM